MHVRTSRKLRGCPTQAVSLLPTPSIELLDVEHKVGQKFAAVQLGRQASDVRVVRPGDQNKVSRIHGQTLRPQPNSRALHEEQIRREAQVPAQRSQALAQTLARLRIGMVTP